MARILLFGPRGMLGSALARVLGGRRHTVTPCCRTRFDIGAPDWSGLASRVRGHQYVLNAAGLIDRRAASPELRRRVNAAFPHALAQACEAAGAHLIQFSTDGVFDGRDGPYDEGRPPDACDEYGRTKALGEPASALTLRTGVIGPECDRFHNLLCGCLSRRSMDGYVDHRLNGITTLALAEAVARIIEADLFVAGTRHLHAEDTDRHTLLRLICRAFGHDAMIRAVPGPAPRDTRLRSVHPAFLQALHLPPIAAQVEAMARQATPIGGWRAA